MALVHPTRNQDLNLTHYGKPIEATELSQGSGQEIWWQCPVADDHEWEAPPVRINRQTKKDFTGCPCCRGLKVVPSNSLHALYPEVANLWHPAKNEDITPHDITPHSSKKRIWWQCKVNPEHVWDQVPAVLTGMGCGCPYCAGQRFSPERSLAAIAPHLVPEWDEERNKKRADEVMAKGGSSDWWICTRDSRHRWKEGRANRINKGVGCPFCSNKRASPTNNLAVLYPDIAAQWHPTKNGNKKPEDYPAGSYKRGWWQCPVADDHEWSGVIGERTTQGKKSCPFCLGRKVSVTNSLLTTRPEIAAEWHPTKNGDLTPDKVTNGTHSKFWWKCPVADDHEWEASPDSRTRTGCPCCAGQKIVPSNSLAATRPEIAAEWHPTKNGKLTPSDVMRGSDEKAWWLCSRDESHIWKTRIASRGAHSSGCPKCTKKNQWKVFQFMQELFPDQKILFDFKHHEMRHDSSNYPMELDIWIPEMNLAIEYQGEQHFWDVEVIKGWKISQDLLTLQNRDQQKRDACKEKGIRLLEIPYTWKGTMDWLVEFLNGHGILCNF